jgi:hypothetical protein
MVQNYTDFKERGQLQLYDRVICHSKNQLYDATIGHNMLVDFEGQTGIIIQVYNHSIPKIFTIFFDNLFSPYLTSVDKKTKCTASVFATDVEKVEIIASKYPLTQFSPNIKKILEFIDYMLYPYKLDINYIDVGEDPNYITYITNNRLARLNEGEDPFKSSLRDKMAVGKFLKKLNPYSDNVNVERKVNIYKAMYDNFIVGKNVFKMVQGNDVIEWYQEKRYFPGLGSLNKSCMRNHRTKLELYNDPSRVAMLILISPDDQLLGRALVWNVTEPNVTYMDRVYTVFPEHEELFYQIASENGWYNFRDNENEFLIIRYDHDIGDEYENPYMDTFKYFVRKGGKHGDLYLTSDELDYGKYVVELEQTESEPEDDYGDDD